MFFKAAFFRLRNIFYQHPIKWDAVALSCFAILITLQPYFLRGGINYFELGIYLPGINNLLDGKIPYRDFFHLRGPLELYVPALLMRFFGESVSVLCSYFYIGTIIGLILCVFIAKEIYKTRFVLYLMIPVLIGRTFPRVVFHIWGGMRFDLGLIVILCIVYFLRNRNIFLIFLSGIATALALLTSIEIGICSGFCLVATLITAVCFNFFTKREAVKVFTLYAAGISLILLPYGVYLIFTQSLVPFLDSIYSVATKMTKVFPDYFFEEHPRNFFEAILSMNPLSKHFKHLTPAYCYLFFVGFMVRRIKNKNVKISDVQITCIASYGLIMYLLAFRKIGAGQFEMALQPEKIVLFFMLERAFFFFKERKNMYFDKYKTSTARMSKLKTITKVAAIYFLMTGFVMSSIGYSIARYNKRFFTYKYVRNVIMSQDVSKLTPLNNEKSTKLTKGRARGMTVPAWQAKDFDELTKFVQNNTDVKEPVFMFPELGFYNFIVDRPFIGRFPMATFSWINDKWHDEFMRDLKNARPRFAVVSRDPGVTFERAYFKIKKNKKNFDDVSEYIERNYTLVSSTPSLYIYKLK